MEPHFNSRPHGGRPITSQNFSLSSIFQLTPSRRATDFYFTHGILLSFQLTPSRRATGHLCHGLQRHGISTHALTEGDNTALSGCTEEERFQLTPSRRATVTGRCLRLSASYFNSRPHGGRRDSDRIKDVFAYISTHALTEGDHILIRYSTRYPHFNSRPHGGRPELYALFFQIFRISTHALTEGEGAKMDFHIPNLAFQLTPSRRATLRCELAVQLCNISTHALTEGEGNISLCQRLQHISTHALTEGDRGCWSCWKKQNISTHALTEGDRSARRPY